MTQAAEFSAFLIGDFTNTLVDLSDHTTKMPPPLDFGMTELTTFQAGGGQTATKSVKGSVTSAFDVTVLIDPSTQLMAAQLIANRGGSTIQMKMGHNAAPVQGDQYYSGTFTLFSLAINAATNDKPADMTWHFEPADVALTGVTPGWYTI